VGDVSAITIASRQDRSSRPRHLGRGPAYRQGLVHRLVPCDRFLAEYSRSQRTCWNDRETKSTLARYRAGRWGT
jgi:hypothetical protein